MLCCYARCLTPDRRVYASAPLTHSTTFPSSSLHHFHLQRMVHHRFNERETNPNKHINFITALPAPGVPSPYSEEDARQLLRALAAQVRPIMKSHGFTVNSFEEV